MSFPTTLFLTTHNSLPHNTQLSSSRTTNYYFEDNDNEHESFVCLPIQWSDKEKMEGSAVGLYLSGTSDHRQRFLSSTNQLHFRPLSPCRSTELADRRTTQVPYRRLRNSNWWLNNAITTKPTKPNFVVNAM